MANSQDHSQKYLVTYLPKFPDKNPKTSNKIYTEVPIRALISKQFIVNSNFDFFDKRAS